MQNVTGAILSPKSGESVDVDCVVRGIVTDNPRGTELWLVMELGRGKFQPYSGSIFRRAQQVLSNVDISLVAGKEKKITIHLIICSKDTGGKFREHIAKSKPTQRWLSSLFDSKKIDSTTVTLKQDR